MPSPRSPLAARVEEEIPISILGFEEQAEMLWISRMAVVESSFPPCIRNIVPGSGKEKGCHRKGAILASFLGQCGWNDDEARPLWRNRVSAEERIYEEWFRKMHCPKCETIKRESKGYPDLGTADLDLCQPDEKCLKFKSPVEYAASLFSEEDRSCGRQEQIKTTFLAHLFNWKTGKEFDIDLSREEKEKLESLQKSQMEMDKVNTTLILTWKKVRGRLRPRFRLEPTELPRRRMLSELL